MTESASTRSVPPLLTVTATPTVTSPTSQHSYFVGRSVVDFALQQRLVHEILECHARNTTNSSRGRSSTTTDTDIDTTDTDTDTTNMSTNHPAHTPDATATLSTSTSISAPLLSLSHAVETSSTSIPLALGNIECGGDLSTILPLAVSVARRAFHLVATTSSLDSHHHHHHQVYCHDGLHAPHESLDTLLHIAQSPLSGLALLYGVHASMPPHYDAPTRPPQRNEWLTLITLGNAIDFVCQDQIVTLHSGDVMVMDAMAVLHGVQRVHVDAKEPPHTVACRLQMPWSQARLGLLFWQGRDTASSVPTGTRAPAGGTTGGTGSMQDDMVVDGLDTLFPEC